jgi:hypothetical protein
MDEDTLTVWLDTALLMLGGFVLMTILMLTAVNRQAQAKVADEQAPGNIIVEAHWPPSIDADVDLWVQAPGDRPVGYSHMSGKYFNLLRDDLGGDLDYEVAYSRGNPAGEYVVNIHMYRAGADVTFPLSVQVAASLKTNGQPVARPLDNTTVKLVRQGDEITAFRFTLDRNGHLVPGSVNNLFKELRTAAR